MADVRLALEGAFETTVGTSSELAVFRHVRFWQRPSWLAIFAVGLVGLTSLTAWFVLRPEAPRLVRFTVSPEEAGPLHIGRTSPDIAISPSGEHIVYLTGTDGSSAEQLQVRALDQLAAVTLVSGGELNSPFFSPAGESIGFYDREEAPVVLKRVSVNGGPTSVICDLPGSLLGASWGEDDTIVFAADGVMPGLWRVAATGGEPEPLTSPDPERGEVGHLWPYVLPGGEAVLFTIAATAVEDSQIAVLSLASGEQTVLIEGGSYPQYASTGHLLYSLAGNLWAVAFDLSRLETVGSPVPVQEGVLTKPRGAANFSLSQNGSLVYVPSRSLEGSALVWVDRQGQVEMLAAERRQYGGLRLSPDGRRAVLTVSEAENTDLVVYDLERDIMTRLTFDPAPDDFPVWTPDGERVVFTSTRNGGGLRICFRKPQTGPVRLSV